MKSQNISGVEDKQDMQKWETHLHTKKGSICGQVSPRNVAKIYAQAGYDGIVITNHFNLANFENYYKGRKINWVSRFLKEYRSLKKHCKKYGIKVLLGMEMCLAGDERTKDSPEYSELLVYGITPEELDDFGLNILYRSQKDFFDLCNQNGWICGQSHPFRADNVKQLDFRLMHFLEAYNGHFHHENRNDLAARAAEEFNLIPIGGSDFHNSDGIGCGLLFPDDLKIENEKDFAAAVMSGKGRIIYR